MTQRNSMILLLLALLFIAPGITAYLFYTHPHWLGAARTNKGMLLTPPVQLSQRQTDTKWRLVLWQPEGCAGDCLKQLDKLARIRLALGRHLYEIEQWLMLGREQQQLSEGLTASFKEQDIQVQYASETDGNQLRLLSSDFRVFIANPEGYLILAYGLNAKPDDIFHDIKQLLSVERKRG